MEKTENNDREKADRIYTVGLEKMEFAGFHGCREDEKIHGNIFSVDLTGTYRSCAGQTDDLNDTINYGQVYRSIAAVMYGERCNLLETLACRIVEALASEFKGFERIVVTVGKKNPPVDGPCAWSTVSTEWVR